MCDMDHVLKDIYTSDTILIQDEEMMLEQVHIRYLTLWIIYMNV